MLNLDKNMAEDILRQHNYPATFIRRCKDAESKPRSKPDYQADQGLPTNRVEMPFIQWVSEKIDRGVLRKESVEKQPTNPSELLMTCFPD